MQESKTLEMRYMVTEKEAIHFLGPEATPVLSTPALVSWLELTSRDNCRPLLNPGEDTVGVSVDVKHLAPTPVGMEVRVVSRLERIEGRLYYFQVEAFDAVEKIGEAHHVRASVNVSKFAARVAAKAKRIV